MIELKHSSTIIHNYKRGDSVKLEKILSVWDEGIHNYKWFFYIIDEEENKMIIPRGFKVSYLKYLFPNKKIIINTESNKSKKAIMKLTTEPRTKLQEEAIDFLLERNKSKHLIGVSQKFLCLATGDGKTYCAINYIIQRKQRSMVILDKDEIMSQWERAFLKFSNLDKKELYYISGSDTIKKIMKNKIDLNYKVFIASHRTLASYAKDDWNKLDKFFKKIQIGIKIYDEAHIEFKNIFMIDSYSNVKETIYLTATPGRSNKSEDKVYNDCFQEVPKFGLNNRTDERYHNIYYISYNSTPDLKELGNSKNKYGFDINYFADYTFEDNFNKIYPIINKLIKMTKNKKGKTAIIIQKLEHVKKLNDYLKKDYPDIDLGLFCSLVKDKKSQLNKKIILSTFKSMEKAVDINMLRFLIMTVPISSSIMTEQVLGRLRKLPELDSYYFDLTDEGFPSCRNQRYIRRDVLDKRAKSIKILKL